MDSQNASVTARQPQRERGRLRVAALLEAADQLFASKGFEATTMTEIAAQAGSSIGSLYQFFPTKEHVADAVLTDHAADLYQRMDLLTQQATQWSVADTARHLFTALIQFRAAHPAFAVLVEARGAPPVKAMGVRQKMREHVLAILRLKAPDKTDEALAPVAVVVLQIMKAAVALNGEEDLPTRPQALDEMREMLVQWLTSRLNPTT
ncbi:AcrR family transcriptional regulator [Silvimonas terrae]|uniref:AcrR family transcriptional regulator n=1 Tax=Silvimonas terrae TaxID=300266 RepID=A0A840RIL9_9NEIS|nr:TetR/AcrR family transcriptional regulator [Silvimonas terrae]MBB5192368.1 AcrR family transcriptional regulator [Silvimonas terrae]